MSNCDRKRNFCTTNFRTVLAAVLQSYDDDSDQNDFTDMSDSSECSFDGKTQPEDDTQGDDTRSDDDSSATADALQAASASGVTFTWSFRPTIAHQRLAFTGSPGRKVDVDDTNDPLAYFRLFITQDLPTHIVSPKLLC